MTLLLQVGLVDTSKGLGNDGNATQMAGLKGSMLSAGSLTVVLPTNNNPPQSLLLVVSSNIGDGVEVLGELVEDGVGLLVLIVNGSNEEIVGDIVQVTSVLQPGASHGDMIGGALS